MSFQQSHIVRLTDSQTTSWFRGICRRGSDIEIGYPRRNPKVITINLGLPASRRFTPIIDEWPMIGFRNRRIAWLAICLTLVAALPSEFTAVKVALTGVSLGSAAVRTTGSVGVATVKVALPGRSDSNDEPGDNSEP